MTIKIRIVAAEDFGRACLKALIEGVGARPVPVVGLPTGNTPVHLYESLRAAVSAGSVDISSWRPFAIDEYGGPRNHPCSNRAFFARYWDVIPGAAPVIQFEPEAAETDASIATMAESFESAGGLTVSVLGIGMNGHLAFNEPGSLPDSLARRVDLHEASRVSGSQCWGEEIPAWGLTLGLRELLGAETVLVLANGAAKADIIARAIEGEETPECPASFVRHANRAIWVLDEAAAGALRKR